MRAPFGEGRRFVVQDAAGPTADAILLAGGDFDVTDAARSDLVSRLDAKDDHGRTVDGLVAANATQAALTMRVANTAIEAVLAGSPSTSVAGEPIRSFWDSEDLSGSQRAFGEQRTSRFAGS